MTFSESDTATANAAIESASAPDAMQTSGSLTLRHVLCLAGDVTVAGDEAREIARLKETEPEALYAECLRLLVGRRSVPAFAEVEWNTLLGHRQDLETKLGRPVGLQTAALDFFFDPRPQTPEMILVPLQVIQDLRQEARVDPTTGLFTAATFAWAFEHEVRRARRYRRHMVMLLLELDDMDTVQGRRGHEFADFARREVARLITENIRNTDTPARIETDAFAVLLHECKLSDGRALAERLRNTIAIQSFSPAEGHEGAHITASIAVVGYPESGDGVERLMSRARTLVAKAKENGKNRVETTSPLPL